MSTEIINILNGYKETIFVGQRKKKPRRNQPRITRCKEILNNTLKRRKPIVIPPKILKFDGQHLGQYNFADIVKWIYPCKSQVKGNKTATFYALINYQGYDYPAILKRNSSRRNDQIVMDEIKPVFGLLKMGTHPVRLKGVPKKINKSQPWILPTGDLNLEIENKWTDYYIFRATTHHQNDKMIFNGLATLEQTVWVPTVRQNFTPEHKYFYEELKKIVLFRDIARISTPNMENIMILPTNDTINICPKSSDLMKAINNDPESQDLAELFQLDIPGYLPSCPYRPLSIGETKIHHPEENYLRLKSKYEKFLFPRITSRSDVLVKMLGLEAETCGSQLEKIRNTLGKIIHKVDNDQMWLVNSLIEKICDLAIIHFRQLEIKI